ncbi:MAG: hypothetical protein ACMG55_13295 [Microcoleus sp.]
MFTKKKITGYILSIFVIVSLLLMSYKLGEGNAEINTEELNPIILELLTKRTDPALNDVNLTRVEYWDTSYFPFNLENNVLDNAYVQFTGIYMPIGKQFILKHSINIYSPGSAPTFTFAMKSYNDYISRNTNPKILELNEMDQNSWGFCYLELNICYMDTIYDDLISSISIDMTDANEQQILEILSITISAFYERAETLSIKSNYPVSAATLSAQALYTATPFPTPSQVHELLMSPDGTKKVQTRDWKNLEIVKSDGSILWVFSYNNKFEVSEPGVEPFLWSKDGKYIYITCYHGPDDSSIKFYGNHFKDGDCLIRFDIETGKTMELIPDLYPGYYAIAISPDDNLIVYANQNDAIVKVKLLDLKTKSEKIIFTAEKNIIEVGSFGWSPDMSKLLLSISHDEGKDSIFLLDLATLKVEPIITNFSKFFMFDSWDENGQVYYRDSYQFGDLWELDLEQKMFIP